MNDEKEIKTRKGKYYVAYVSKPKSISLYGHVILESNGGPDIGAFQEEIEKLSRTKNSVILSCIKAK